ncbi:MAG: hypothetical protein QOK38_2497 [Acidobacteriaceae bacterium]|nr:hypothetical protein [Acidobacteriaceae bacterium]
MKAILLSLAFEVASRLAFAQGADDPMAHLRACSLMERAERLECLDRLSRDIAPPDRSVRGGDNWIISETTSPVNYTPIVTATAFSRGGSDGSPMQLSIHCRGGRTELVVSGPAISGGGADYTISYRVNDGQPVQLAAGSPSFGPGAAFTGDVVRLLQSLPEEGHVAVRVSTRSGAAQDGHFLLGGLKTVREKLAAACKWPHAVARPRN